MNKDRIQGKWRQFKGQLREQWGRLLGDDFDALAGKRAQFLGRAPARHGIPRDPSAKQQADGQARCPDFRFDD